MSPRHELAALAATTLDVLDAVDRAGQETTDVPRLWLQSLVRWANDADEAEALAELGATLRTQSEHLHGPKGDLKRLWGTSVATLLSLYLRLQQNPTALHAPWVKSLLVKDLPAVLVGLGEERRAARARVMSIHAMHVQVFEGRAAS